ncbi:MAG: 23S rRNA pseudouridine synthase F [Candidatus Yanofskybacteria bacterium CG10_big_fil_rev_8_21_14_0_10_37_15]|uniref:Pseudouridine synthase n=1 Tax=Candidatus Yanofskybacteria bacterium CG10_big_fil_rev_8_21_14_0_10_37_15 TaxID=1975097 RepID=A0A2H0R5A1_9BACT|nr:MAG: 23S rRNA pseudouridine synthase F [Candidatus Yanofskybacteria bacterium CG10_big_fil_rev_8_21_14_0_10_37_15]
MKYPIRINKYLRDEGFVSRREADKLVESGLVFINGEKAKNGVLVNENDKIDIRGKLKENKYLAFYKPRGLATQDLLGKKSVISEWKKHGLYPIGRLDKESEGLLILTNDGRFARKILSEKSEYEKEYVVTVKEPLRAGIPAIFKSGMQTKTLGKLLPAKAKILNKNTIQIILSEGKRHQIRIMLDELRYTVVSLKRIRIGNIKLDNLKSGQTRSFVINKYSLK